MVRMIAEAGIGGWLQVGLLALGLLWSLVVAVLVGIRWKVPAVVAVAPLLAHAFAAALGASLAGNGALTAMNADPAQRATMYAASIAGTISNGTLASAAIPSAMLLALGAVAAGVRGPRRFGAPIGVILFCGITAMMPALSMVWNGSLPLAAGRLVVYGLAAFPTAMAFCGAHPRTNAREASIIAAAAWTTLVAVGEMATLASGWTRGFNGIAMMGTADKGAVVNQFLAEMSPLQTLGMITLAVSAVPMVIAFFRADIELTAEEVLSGSVSNSPVRSIGAFLAALTPLVWLLAMWSCSPADMVAHLAANFSSSSETTEQ